MQNQEKENKMAHSRPLKFRAWNEKDFGMHYGGFSIHATGTIENGIITPEHVMQFTGLKDRNGTEIYDGDIVKSEKMDGKVIWGNHNGWGIHGQLISYDWENCEVIGNIHENPELLANPL